MNSVTNFASVQLFVTKIRVEFFCQPALFVSSHLFAASARLRRRSLLNLIENRKKIVCPSGTIRTGRVASTGATCRSCPNPAPLTSLTTSTGAILATGPFCVGRAPYPQPFIAADYARKDISEGSKFLESGSNFLESGSKIQKKLT